MTTLPDYKPSFPAWKTKNLGDHVAGSTAESVEMLAVSSSFPTSPSLARSENARQSKPFASTRECLSPPFPPRPSVPGVLLPDERSADASPMLYKQGMLVYDPAKRMSAKAALKSDYFRLSPGMKL